MLVGRSTSNREFPVIVDELSNILDNYLSLLSNSESDDYNTSKIIKIDEKNWDTVRLAAEQLKSPIKCMFKLLDF